MTDPLNLPGTLPIPFIDAPSVSHFERAYRRPGKPVKLRLSTPALSLSELLQDFGELSVSALPTVSGKLAGTADKGTAFQTVRLSDVLTPILSNEAPPWHISTPLSELPEALQARLPGTLPYIQDPGFIAARLWLAPPGTVTPLHWDVPNNFLRVLHGRRRVLLYPPMDGLWLRPNSVFSKMVNFSGIDPEAPRADEVSRLRFTRPQVTILQPGEALFIPPGWWHHIRSLETSMAMNMWWGRGLHAAVWRLAQAFKGVRGAFRGEWKRPVTA